MSLALTCLYWSIGTDRRHQLYAVSFFFLINQAIKNDLFHNQYISTLQLVMRLYQKKRKTMISYGLLVTYSRVEKSLSTCLKVDIENFLKACFSSIHQKWDSITGEKWSETTVRGLSLKMKFYFVKDYANEKWAQFESNSNCLIIQKMSRRETRSKIDYSDQCCNQIGEKTRFSSKFSAIFDPWEYALFTIVSSCGKIIATTRTKVFVCVVLIQWWVMIIGILSCLYQPWNHE